MLFTGSELAINLAFKREFQYTVDVLLRRACLDKPFILQTEASTAICNRSLRLSSLQVRLWFPPVQLCQVWVALLVDRIFVIVNASRSRGTESPLGQRALRRGNVRGSSRGSWHRRSPAPPPPAAARPPPAPPGRTCCWEMLEMSPELFSGLGPVMRYKQVGLFRPLKVSSAAARLLFAYRSGGRWLRLKLLES